jgi:hypothetical protein
VSAAAVATRATAEPAIIAATAASAVTGHDRDLPNVMGPPETSMEKDRDRSDLCMVIPQN